MYTILVAEDNAFKFYEQAPGASEMGLYINVKKKKLWKFFLVH